MIFNMMHYGGWSFTEIYNLPVKLRKWFFERIAKEMKDRADATKRASRRGR